MIHKPRGRQTAPDTAVQTTGALSLKVRPRSSRSRLERTAEGEFAVCVHAPAVDDAANRELIEVLAGALGVPKSAVRIVRGRTSRAKQIAVAGLTGAEAWARLERAAS